MSGRALTVAAIVYAAVLLGLASPASTHELGVSAVAAQDVADPCPGDEITPDRVITGSFNGDLEGGYALLPVDVPAGQTALRVKYCFDQPEMLAPGSPDRHTLDLGLYEPRADTSVPWGLPEFRGWGGSSHPDVTLSQQGYSSEATYLAGDREAGRTSRAFEPGPIGAGEWAVELGLASITETGNMDDEVEYRVEIDWSDDEAFDDDPYRAAPYDESPAATEAGWYAGDFHVHGEHSALGDATMTETFDYAFDEPGAQPPGAGLDFITLSDYVSGSSWDEIGNYQAQHPDKLIVRSAEVITYRGHANSHANTSVVDYRLGPLYELQPDGSLTTVRPARPASEIFDRVESAGGFTQISHPTIFPSEVPAFASLCRGCPWDYDAASTDYSKVDAIEIATGPPGVREAPAEPGPNPFTVTALRFWEEALADGHKIAAVASSDSHNAGRTPGGATQAPIGTATTVVRADELSEDGIQRGVQAGHTYVKVYGADGPDLRFEAVPGAEGARAAQAAQPAIMGDTVAAGSASLTARVLGGAPGSIAARPDPLTLLVLRDGAPLRAAPVTSDDFELAFEATEPGRYRLQVMRGTAIEAVSSPIYLEPPRVEAPAGSGGESGSGTGGDGGGGGGAGGGSRGNGGSDERNPDGRRPVADGPAEPIARAPRSEDGDDPVQSLSDGGGELPFTGLALTTLALLGAGLVCSGVRLRRRA